MIDPMMAPQEPAQAGFLFSGARCQKKLIPNAVLGRLAYDNGNLRWASHSKRASIGQIAGSVGRDGYRYIKIGGTKYVAHRIVWACFYGDTAMEIDHINRNRDDNRIENLRAVSRQENLRNVVGKGGNKGGLPGVTWRSDRNCWQVSICVDYRNTQIGRFADYFDACCARKSAEASRWLPKYEMAT